MSMSERCEPCQDLRSQSHIAQQSRRDKLRVQQQQQLHNSEIGASLMPLYDPSEMLTFITGNNDDRSDFQNQTIPISYKASSTTSDLILNYAGSQNPLLDGPIAIPSVLSSSPAGTIKQTNFSSSSSSSSSASSASPSSQNLFLMNPSFSYPMNPNTTNQETHKQFVEVPIPLNFNGFSQSLYSPQVPQNLSTYSSLRFSNGSFNEGVGGFKQEPLSLTQDSTGQEGLSLSLAFQNPPAELHLQQFDTRFDLTHGSDMFNVGHHHDKTAKPDDDIYNRQLIESSYCSGSYPRDGNGNGNGNGKGSTNNVLVPLGPFTGYATVLKSSRFLKPAQQLLDGFCNVGHAVPIQVLNKEQEMLLEGATGGHGSGSFDPTSRVSTVVESCSSSVFTSNIEGGSECAVDDPLASGGDRSENQKKKMKLMSMLDEVCRRYRHYYEQLQAVVGSFDSVAGLRSAAPYTCLALKVISRHFRCLKNAIANQLHSISKALGEDCHDKEEEIPRMRFVDRRGASPLRRSGGIIGQQNVWRPQRGLPERAVTLLRAWLFEHFLHPYPTDADKQMMAKQTGLSRSQVSNWFINARVRLWKPMVEEIHMLETRQPSSTSAMDLNNSIKKPDTLSEELNNLQNQQQKTTIEVFPGEQQQQQQNNDQPIKRSRSEHTSMIRREESINFSYENLNPLDSHAGIRIGAVGNTSSSGVSLTLGLHHNGIQEKYHNNSNNNNVFLSQTEHEVAHHFRSLQQQGNDGSEAFGFDSFVGAQQSLQLRKQIGCQSLHDFVG